MLVAAWSEDEGARVRLVYAFPSIRFATLRHWRDEAEYLDGGLHVVALEASKWARLLLKRHRATGDTSARLPEVASSSGSLLRDLNADLAGATSAPQRFALVDAWLEAVRREADAAPGTGRDDAAT